MMHRKDTRHMESSGRDRMAPLPAHRAEAPSGRVLELVLKCDSYGSMEAVLSALKKIENPGIGLQVISAGVGTIGKSDLLMALGGSRLVLGFNVEIMPKLEGWLKDHGVEVRLYDVIYKLIEDMEQIARNMLPPRLEEKITGKARVIALFKSSRHGIILGCEVTEGAVMVGSAFRVITAMGPVYSGKVESLQIEKKPVKEGKKGQQIGLKVTHFDGVKVGDLVECYQKPVQREGRAYKTSGSILSFKN